VLHLIIATYSLARLADVEAQQVNPICSSLAFHLALWKNRAADEEVHLCTGMIEMEICCATRLEVKPA
jgi:hypothetical protein